jgi:hypothetical protein
VTAENPIAEFEISSGAQRGSRLTLHANRLVYEGGDTMEAVPLSQLAAVRVAFERDPRKLNWAAALLLVALFLAAIAGPLQSGIAAAASKVGDPARRESLDAMLYGVFNALSGLASLLPGVAAALAVTAVALLVFFWLGATVLTLAFAATERVYEVHGRNRLLMDFAHVVAEQLARRGS